MQKNANTLFQNRHLHINLQRWKLMDNALMHISHFSPVMAHVSWKLSREISTAPLLHAACLFLLSPG